LTDVTVLGIIKFAYFIESLGLLLEENTMDQEFTFAQFGGLLKLMVEVSKATKLSYVHIVPAELVGHDLWEKTISGDSNEFNARLGVAASSIVSRELQTRFALKSAENAMKAAPQNKSFRIGVAGGQTAYFVVDGMSVLEAGSFEVEIAPLVIGSVPRHRYSAGTVAEMMGSKIRYQAPKAKRFASVVKMEQWLPAKSEDYWKAKLEDGIIRERDGANGRIKEKGFFDLNYVLVGVGQHNKVNKTTNLCAHLEALYPSGHPDELTGDICSRLFDGNGKEIDREKQDKFVAISFEVLELLAAKKIPVIAVAGGLSKVDAIKTITLKRPGKLINGLITDELTAMQLFK